jgi:hypothetical protein
MTREQENNRVKEFLMTQQWIPPEKVEEHLTQYDPFFDPPLAEWLKNEGFLNKSQYSEIQHFLHPSPSPSPTSEPSSKSLPPEAHSTAQFPSPLSPSPSPKENPSPIFPTRSPQSITSSSKSSKSPLLPTRSQPSSINPDTSAPSTILPAHHPSESSLLSSPPSSSSIPAMPPLKAIPSDSNASPSSSSIPAMPPLKAIPSDSNASPSSSSIPAMPPLKAIPSDSNAPPSSSSIPAMPPLKVIPSDSNASPSSSRIPAMPPLKPLTSPNADPSKPQSSPLNPVSSSAFPAFKPSTQSASHSVTMPPLKPLTSANAEALTPNVLNSPVNPVSSSAFPAFKAPSSPSPLSPPTQSPVSSNALKPPSGIINPVSSSAFPAFKAPSSPSPLSPPTQSPVSSNALKPPSGIINPSSSNALPPLKPPSSSSEGLALEPSLPVEEGGSPYPQKKRPTIQGYSKGNDIYRGNWETKKVEKEATSTGVPTQRLRWQTKRRLRRIFSMLVFLTLLGFSWKYTALPEYWKKFQETTKNLFSGKEVFSISTNPEIERLEFSKKLEKKKAELKGEEKKNPEAFVELYSKYKSLKEEFEKLGKIEDFQKDWQGFIQGYHQRCSQEYDRLYKQSLFEEHLLQFEPALLRWKTEFIPRFTQIPEFQEKVTTQMEYLKNLQHWKQERIYYPVDTGFQNLLMDKKTI